MALLVFDEQIANPKLVGALQDRGIDARTVGDFGVTGRPDPDVVRRVQDGLSSKAWVLVTMDLTIVEEHEGFKWERYALAWIKVRDGLLGVKFEQEKANIVQRHAHLICQQTAGQHYTYTARAHFKNPPRLALPGRRQK